MISHESSRWGWRRGTLSLRVAGAGCLALALYLAFVAQSPVPQVLDQHQDKAAHVLAFGVLAITFGCGARPGTLALCAASLASLAVGIEWAQEAFTANREFSLKDIVASGAGLGAGLIVAWLFTHSSALTRMLSLGEAPEAGGPSARSYRRARRSAPTALG